MYRFLILFIIHLFSVTGRATHIIGGEVFYQYLGNFQYNITLKLYKDGCFYCYMYDHPTSLYIFTSNGALFQEIEFDGFDSTMVPTPSNDTCHFNVPVKVWEVILDTIINLPPAYGGYNIVYQRCCRPNKIVNITSSDEFGTSYIAHVPNPDSLQNSAPYFKSYPPIFLCVGDTFLFDHSANDLDGDSLVYELCGSLEGANQFDPKPDPPLPPPYNYIQYEPPYSGTYPMDANPPLTIDLQTGFLSGRPLAIGKYNVTVCISEYRNDNFIGVSSRDFLFNVGACIINDFSAGFSYSDSGLTVTFLNTSVGNDSASYRWNFGDGSFSTDSNPIHTYNVSGTFIVCLTINDKYCYDIFCDTITVLYLSNGRNYYIERTINIFPNPLNEYITFEISDKQIIDEVNFELFNGIGQRVLSRKLMTNGKFILERGALADGLYYYKISDSTGLFKAGKLMIE